MNQQRVNGPEKRPQDDNFLGDSNFEQNDFAGGGANAGGSGIQRAANQSQDVQQLKALQRAANNSPQVQQGLDLQRRVTASQPVQRRLSAAPVQLKWADARRVAQEHNVNDLPDKLNKGLMIEWYHETQTPSGIKDLIIGAWNEGRKEKTKLKAQHLKKKPPRKANANGGGGPRPKNGGLAQSFQTSNVDPRNIGRQTWNKVKGNPSQSAFDRNGTIVMEDTDFEEELKNSITSETVKIQLDDTTAQDVPLVVSHSGALRLIRGWKHDYDRDRNSCKKGPLFAFQRGQFIGLFETNFAHNDVIYRDLRHIGQGEDDLHFAHKSNKVFTWTEEAQALNAQGGGMGQKLNHIFSVMRERAVPESEHVMNVVGAMMCDVKWSITGHQQNLNELEHYSGLLADWRELFDSDPKNKPHYKPSAKNKRGGKNPEYGRKSVNTVKLNKLNQEQQGGQTWHGGADPNDWAMSVAPGLEDEQNNSIQSQQEFSDDDRMTLAFDSVPNAEIEMGGGGPSLMDLGMGLQSGMEINVGMGTMNSSQNSNSNANAQTQANLTSNTNSNVTAPSGPDLNLGHNRNNNSNASNHLNSIPTGLNTSQGSNSQKEVRYRSNGLPNSGGNYNPFDADYTANEVVRNKDWELAKKILPPLPETPIPNTAPNQSGPNVNVESAEALAAKKAQFEEMQDLKRKIIKLRKENARLEAKIAKEKREIEIMKVEQINLDQEMAKVNRGLQQVDEALNSVRNWRANNTGRFNTVNTGNNGTGGPQMMGMQNPGIAGPQMMGMQMQNNGGQMGMNGPFVPFGVPVSAFQMFGNGINPNGNFNGQNQSAMQDDDNQSVATFATDMATVGDSEDHGDHSMGVNANNTGTVYPETKDDLYN